MQVTCFGIDWKEVSKRSSAAAIVEEMLETDDIDSYTTELPEGTWPNDSAAYHFDVAEVLSELQKSVDATKRESLSAVAALISDGDSIDELGLSPLTEGCYFVSLSPERVATLHGAFSSLDMKELTQLYSSRRSDSPAEFESYLNQWRAALAFAHERGLGLIGHCG